ncbi:MAG: hypothetical protein IPO90_06050 [Flavobacteriales bacterium]|nr:hypothetical protein [Flavobacteriales bacterium]MBL0043902.1 hypothetical protein [Flavobacteriales bacterium]
MDVPAPRTDRSADERVERLGLASGDYYWSPEGFLVFTEQYHLKRGACCGNKCRHCPYGHKAVLRVQR